MEFASGQAAATISITVHDDVFAELDETSVITLVEVLEKGTTLPDRGAVIGDVPRLAQHWPRHVNKSMYIIMYLITFL